MARGGGKGQSPGGLSFLPLSYLEWAAPSYSRRSLEEDGAGKGWVTAKLFLGARRCAAAGGPAAEGR